MSADQLLSRLENVKRTGAGRWIARCPAHDDRRASLAIRETETGVILVHDFAGCAVESVLAALGIDMADLFPERDSQHGKPERRPIPAADVLRCVSFEALVVALAAQNIADGKVLSDTDMARLRLASQRLQAAGSAFHG